MGRQIPEPSEESKKILEKYRELFGEVLKFSEVMKVLVVSAKALPINLPEDTE
ncbi:hypothetical protein FLA_4541 [Filimonas lacunae]|nr:hypothetical protein FLA_4541 [Filimonas lacunae]